MAEKMITLGKKILLLHAVRLLHINEEDVVKKLLTKSRKYAERNGGYTRIHQLGRGDAAEMAILSLVD